MISYRGVLSRSMCIVCTVILMMAFIIPDCSAAGEKEVSKPGGVLKLAVDAEPAGLDCMITTATLVSSISWHIYENLFTFGDKMDVIPMLAKDYSISEDGLKYTINLREGIPFHNGREMGAEDVIASINRWGKVSSTGKSTFKNLDSIIKKSEYRIEINLKVPDALLLSSLAIEAGGAVIVPREIVESAGVEPMKEYVGTGPYQFVEWNPNQHIKLKKFEDYKPLEGKANGYGGRKIAYIDEFIFLFVPDKTVEAAGVEAGDFDYAYAVDSEEYERLKTTPGVQAVVSPPRAWLGFILNNKEGIMADKKMRQAVLAALDMEPILLVSRGHRDIWRMDPSLNQKETIWWSDKSKELYNQNNPEKARKLLQEAGYKGETIRCQASYEGYYNAFLVAKSQLEAVGLKIELNKYEPATESSRRKDSKLWDMSVTGYTMKADPLLGSFMKSSVPGWWQNDEVEKLKARMSIETDFEKRYAMMERIQELFYEDVPYIKIGDYATFRLLSSRVKNFKNLSNIFFWNVRLEE